MVVSKEDMDAKISFTDKFGKSPLFLCEIINLYGA